MYKQKFHAGKFLMIGWLGLQLAGCATNVGKTIKVSDEQMAKFGALSATDALAGLEARINQAMSVNMPFLAPDYYRSATEILHDTQKSADKKPKEEVISNIAKADAILDQGQTMMAVVQSRLANELALKDQLDKDNAGKVFPKEYEHAIGKLSGLIEKVELEKSDKLDKEKIELIKTMQALDVKTIQYVALHEGEVVNEDTRSKEGEKQAPATLAEAVRVYLDAMNRIAQSPHDEAIVKAARADTLFAAHHAKYVNDRVIILQNKIGESNEYIESIVLAEEKRLLGISTALGYKDLRDQPIEAQAVEIARVAGEVVQGQHKSKEEMGAVNDQSKVLENRLMEAKEDLQKLNEKLAKKDAWLAEKDGLLNNKTTLLAEKDAQLAEKDTQLKIVTDQLAQLEAQNKLLLEEKSARTKGKAKSSK